MRGQMQSLTTSNLTRKGWQVTQPGIFSGAPGLQNTNDRPVTVYISSGIVSSVKVTGTNNIGEVATVDTGLTAGTFRLIPGDWIVVTYSIAPIWWWYGD